MPKPEYNAKIAQRIDLTPEAAIFKVVPEGWEVPDFKPGQFGILGLPASVKRCEGAEPDPKQIKDPEKFILRAYSIASSPLTKDRLEFYIVRVNEGALTPRLFTLQTGDTIHLGRKISGHFVMDDVPEDKNIIFIGTGTGLAPYISMTQTFFKTDQQRRFSIWHGVRTSQDLGYQSELEYLARLSPQFHYQPIISRPHLDPIPWSGLTGHVQKIWETKVMEQAWGFRPTPEDTHFFLCGSPQMIDSCLELLGQDGFKEHTKKEPGQIHIERYW